MDQTETDIIAKFLNLSMDNVGTESKQALDNAISDLEQEYDKIISDGEKGSRQN